VLWAASFCWGGFFSPFLCAGLLPAYSTLIEMGNGLLGSGLVMIWEIPGCN